jgi:hypothetical protein
MMPTFVSMLNWSGDPQPQPADVHDAIAARALGLREAGLHSVVFLPDEGACAAIMVATCETDRDVERLAAAILPGSVVDMEAMRFDEPTMPVWLEREEAPPPPAGYLSAVFEAVVAG